MLARQIARYVCIAIVVVVFFFPIYWMLITSMKPQEEVLYYPPTFVPPEFTFRMGCRTRLLETREIFNPTGIPTTSRSFRTGCR